MWQIITRFWTLLAQGYLDCAQACGDSDSLPRGIEEQSPRLAARGLRALRCQLKWLLLRYADIPADVWPACGRLLTLAERGAAAATPLSLYDDSETPSSPHAELLRLAMVHSVSPASLSPAEQHIAERVVVYLTRKFRIDGEHHNRCDYCFDLRGKRPPLRRLANSPTTATTRYLEVSDARHWTSAAYALVCGTGRLPSDLDLGTAVETPTVARVLQQLNVQWSKGAPPRATGRQKIDADLHAVHGYNNVVRVVTASDRGRPDDTRRQAAILLDERPLPDGSLYIVARRGLLDTREAIEARFGADSTSVILEPAGLVESGADFDWLRYRVTSVAF